jgi:hypothetical protein
VHKAASKAKNYSSLTSTKKVYASFTSAKCVRACKEAEVQSKTNAKQKELYDVLPKALDKFQNSERNKHSQK